MRNERRILLLGIRSCAACPPRKWRNELIDSSDRILGRDWRGSNPQLPPWQGGALTDWTTIPGRINCRLIENPWETSFRSTLPQGKSRSVLEREMSWTRAARAPSYYANILIRSFFYGKVNLGRDRQVIEHIFFFSMRIRVKVRVESLHDMIRSNLIYVGLVHVVSMLLVQMGQ